MSEIRLLVGLEMNLLPRSPVWVIVEALGDHRTERSFIRITQSSGYVNGQTFLDCSKWDSLEKAKTALNSLKKEKLVLYRVDEMENGSDRLFLKLTRDPST